MNIQYALGICTIALISSACASSEKASASPWLEASPTLEGKIEQKATKLAFAPTLEERVQLIQWFAGVGEPAYDTLLDLVEDPRSDVAGSALAALGATGDVRLVPFIKNIDLPANAESLALERARTLVRLGDWSDVPVLIEGLKSERPYTRAVCAKTLASATNETFGFEAQGKEEDRLVAIQRWEAWWASRQTDVLLED